MLGQIASVETETFRFTTARWYIAYKDIRRTELNGGTWTEHKPQKAICLTGHGVYDEVEYGADIPCDRHPGGCQEALVCSSKSQLLVIDVDSEEFDATLIGRHVLERGYLPISTRGADRGLPNRHYAVDMRPMAGREWIKQGPIVGGDIKSNGFVPMPGCTHPLGDVYEIVQDAELIVCEEELYALLLQAHEDSKERQRKQRSEGSGSGSAPAHRGGQDTQLYTLVGRLIAHWMPKEEARDEWMKEASSLELKHPSWPWTEDDFEGMWERCLAKHLRGGGVYAPNYLVKLRRLAEKWTEEGKKRREADPMAAEASADAEALGVNSLSEEDGTTGVEATPSAEKASVDRFPSLNWADAFAQDFTKIDYLPGHFMEREQQVALVGAGKAGKSIFIQEWVYRCVAGLPFLGSDAYEPLKVLYFDRENNMRDIVLRMKGFGATPQVLERLDYRLFPGFSGQLDQSATAAQELLTIVAEVKPDIVVLDTVSRFISGSENDADTWLSLYRRVHAPLKAQHIACVRLDHFGKDEERGSRGSSAKTQDVDHVWELTRTSEGRDNKSEPGVEILSTGLRLKRTHSRTGLGEDFFQITRHGAKDRSGMWLPGRTGHTLLGVGGGDPLDVLTGQSLTAAEIANVLDRLEVPARAGEPSVRKALTENSIRAKTEKIREAIKMRKDGQTKELVEG